MATVLIVDVLDDLFTPLMLEVHVDVRRLVPFLGDKTLEQHVQARRIHLGDTQAVADRGIGGRPPSLAKDAAAPWRNERCPGR